MAASDKNIVISPQRGSATNSPSIIFTGDGNDPISIYALDGVPSSLSFEGSAGQLFSITNNLTSGSIFSVNDVSGIPSLDVDASGLIKIAPLGGTVAIGQSIVTSGNILDIKGNVRIDGDLTITQTTKITGLNADKLDSLDSSQFLRSDANDSASGNITFSGQITSSNRIITGSGDAIRLQIGTGGSYFTSVTPASKDIVLRDNYQFRFGSSATWNWNEWAGIGFDSANEVLYIGGPAGAYFSSNASPPLITIDFVGLNNTGLRQDGNIIWHEGNDGAESGLDADLLDGLESSVFARLDNGNSFTGGDLFLNGQKIHFGTNNDSNIGWTGTESRWTLLSGNLTIKDYVTNRFTFERTTGNLTATGRLTAGTDVRGTVFYDVNDTNYYVDPNSSSRLHNVTIRDYGLRLERAYTHSGIWFNGGTDANHVLWNHYYGGPGARGAAGSGWDGMYWNTYRGIQIRAGSGGQYNGILLTGSGGGTNDHVVTLYGYNAAQLGTQNGYAYANNQMRAPIFYDSNNTGYYLNPADGTTSANLNGDVYIANGKLRVHRGSDTFTTYYEDDSTASGRAQVIIESSYSDLIIMSKEANANRHGSTITLATQSTSTNDYAKWVIGQGQYQEGANQLAFAYGTNQTNPHATLGTDNANYDFLIEDGGITYSSGSSRAPIFYDSNDTGYYVNPNSTSNILDLGARRLWAGYNPGIDNSVSCSNWFRSSGNTGWYNGSYGGGIYMQDSTWVRVYNNKQFYSQNYIQSDSSVRTPIFYDSNDTARYIDPANGGFNMKGGTSNRVAYYTSDSGIHVNNAEGVNNTVRLGAAWGRYGVYNDGVLQLMSDSTSGLSFVIDNTQYGTLNTDYFSHTSDIRTPIFYDSNNTGFYLNPASTSYTNYHKINNVFDAATTRFTSPNGGSYTTTTSTITGAIRIRIPADRRRSNTMHRFTVKIYEYSTGRSTQFDIGGYNYSDTASTWYNVFAIQSTDGGRGAFTVRYGDDGSRQWVTIGETGSTWSYPQVHITDVQTGYSGISSNWGAGWNIDFVTTLPTGQTASRTASLVKTSNNASNFGFADYATIFYDANNTGYYSDPAATSVLNNIDSPGLLRFTGSGTNTGIRFNNSVVANDAAGIRQNGTNNNGELEFFSTDDDVEPFVFRHYTTGLDGSGSSVEWARINNDYLSHSSDIRTPIFYDSNNTGFYLDPASTTRLTNLYVNGGVAGISNSSSYTEAALEVRERGFGGAQDDTWATAPRVSFHWGGRVASQIALRSNGEIVALNNPGNAYQNTRCNISYADGSHRSPIYYDSNNTGYYCDPASNSNMNTARFQGNAVYIRGGSPTLYLQDTDHRSSMIHCNSNLWYVLRGSGNDSTTWTTVNNAWPLYLNLENNDAVFGGNITAVGNINSNSDIKLKKNIKQLSNSLERVLSLRGVEYNRIDIEGEPRQIGLIAQEVEKVIPEVVDIAYKHNPDGGEIIDETKTVSYQNIVAVLIEAIKEQQEQINQLKDQVRTLLIEK